MADEKESPGSLTKKKKRTKYYFYVSSQSEEADTLKDKFWRNLEEGKIDVMQTPDLYSKVKCNKKPPGLSVGNFGNAGSPVSTFDSSPSSSCGSCTKSIAASFSVSGYETGSMPSNSPLVDTPIHSPFRNLEFEVGQVLPGSDPSAANATSVQRTWDAEPERVSDCVSTPDPTWQSAGETHTDNANTDNASTDNASTDNAQTAVGDNESMESSGTYAFLLDTNDDTLDCPSHPADTAEGSASESHRCKRLKTKRKRNMSYASRRRQKKSGAELTSSTSELNDETERESDGAIKVEPEMRCRKRSVTGKTVKSKGKKYYYLVEAGSKEADTLKDKFWRDVQEGKLNFCETGDLYSKVKGSRKVVAGQSQDDCDTRDDVRELSPMSDGEEALPDECIDVKDGTVQLGRALRQKVPNGEKRIAKGNRHPNTRLTSKSVFALPESYVELIKTEFFPADDRDAPKLSENDQDPAESRDAIGSETAANESETQPLASRAKNLSSDMLQDTLEPAAAPNQNDCKLLCTCEVTVERLRPEKLPVKEEAEETESKSDTILEDTSTAASESQSPTVEPIATNTAPLEITSGENLISSECSGAQNLLCASPEAELNPNSFNDIDFDPNITLDDLCPTSDTDWPDVLELTEAVGRTLTSENAVLSEEKARAMLSSVDISPTPDQQREATKSLTKATDLSATYAEMRACLMDSLNIFNVNWPASFYRLWGTHVEGALEYAISSGDHQMAVALLRLAPKLKDLERPDANAKTLLMRAVLQGHNHLAEQLIARGALVNRRDASGNTPLMMSAWMGQCSVAKLLLENGAQIDLTNDRGETALMMAVNSGSLDVIKLLLIKGANFALTNVDNLTAMILAQRQQRRDISHLLNSHINRLMSHFQTVIAKTIQGAAELVSTLFPLHCFSLKDSTTFSIRFTHKSVPSAARCAILFIGHAMIGEHTIRCLLHGRSPVKQATLNGKDLRAFTKDGYFVTSFDSVCDGVNELRIHTVRDIQSETKLLVCAYICNQQK